ncbi:MAG: type II toxin-antitoxin system HicB family antitoxin [Methanolobus sp.]|uniref:type II toxin-antitoxin system HicB family antitoxin n=1 Tax=Methanolobus sp. TaxID=1874737 RepID=UPI002731E127|nr:type II toxin-antitoxin system HicB family antitoxin [Methanolobus sp.]MDP2218327.1 type II toxin-antitoxin system HicB family antitoxin [Methanolobus sp.]
MKKYTFPVVIEKDQDGYFAMCPALEGCYSQGDTYEESLENIKDAIRLILEDMEMSDELAPDINSFSLVAVEVTA